MQREDCYTSTCPRRPSSTKTVGCGLREGSRGACVLGGSGCPRRQSHPSTCAAPQATAVKSPNMLIDRSWNVKVTSMRGAHRPAPDVCQSCCMLPFQIADFNLSAILSDKPEAGATAASNPVWLVRNAAMMGNSDRAHSVQRSARIPKDPNSICVYLPCRHLRC